MRTLWLIFRFEVTRQFLRGGYALITFGVPILAIAAFFLIRALSSGDVAVSATRDRGNLPPGVNLPGASASARIVPLRRRARWASSIIRAC